MDLEKTYVLVNLFLKQIYANKDKLLSDICLRNAQLLNSTPTFIFNGKFYSRFNYKIERGKVYNKILHHDLVDKVANIVNEDFDEASDKIIISGLIKKIFEEFVDYGSDCVKDLIPSVYHSFAVMRYLPKARTLSESELKTVSKFKNNNVYAFEVFKTYTLKNYLINEG